MLIAAVVVLVVAHGIVGRDSGPVHALVHQFYIAQHFLSFQGRKTAEIKIPFKSAVFSQALPHQAKYKFPSQNTVNIRKHPRLGRECLPFRVKNTIKHSINKIKLLVQNNKALIAFIR
ncbi:hypothetical protein LOB15_08125 [Lactobacillus delbrueckii subsp. lactis]|nr:hypothetical protein [Lactobacillus delbrueckii subsp. lactis]